MNLLRWIFSGNLTAPSAKSADVLEASLLREREIEEEMRTRRARIIDRIVAEARIRREAHQ